MESWRHSYRGIVPDVVLDTTTIEEVRDRWLGVKPCELATSALVIGDGTHLAGYAMFGPIRGVSHGYSGQLYELYLRPSAMGKGCGRALFNEASQRLQNLDCDGFLLWVFAANTLARRFYERLGGRLIQGASLTTILGNAHLPEVAYGFRPLPATPATR